MDSADQPFQLLLVCPLKRLESESNGGIQYSETILYKDSPEDTFSTRMDGDHRVLPLFWCNNKENNDDEGCKICHDAKFSTNYYFCESCDANYHKECVESPIQIKHPYHSEHSLKLSYYFSSFTDNECLYCGKETKDLEYYCTICNVFMHPTCAMKPMPFVIDQRKRHDHPLTFFPRQTSLVCSVCGLLRKNSQTYVCLICNFVSHEDCMNSPHIIKISRHPHRISYVSSLRYEEWSCGVCRQSINSYYGAYTCGKCGDYAVHSRCALRKDVWDGVELKDVLEEDDLTQDDGPFEIISEGVIHHFLHDHHLRLVVNKFYDEKKSCQACYLPVYEGNYYSCIECNFIIHEACIEARRRIQHPLHPHPLTLMDIFHDSRRFRCDSCVRAIGGFAYECKKDQCEFVLDLRCSSISEPFYYNGHEHPLFLALDPEQKPTCEVCDTICHTQLNCIKCNFIVCIKCATLPYKMRYQHDTHFLTIKFGKEVCEEDWCEACEQNLGDTFTKIFYWCDECCTTLHVSCLLGKEPYKKPGRIFKLLEGRNYGC